MGRDNSDRKFTEIWRNKCKSNCNKVSSIVGMKDGWNEEIEVDSVESIAMHKFVYLCDVARGVRGQAPPGAKVGGRQNEQDIQTFF